nr:reverse transcriptase domain-containing protein [Tanacetum cinerariifolium]
MKQMKQLSGKLSALNIFLSKAAERALPCLDTLKNCTNKKDFLWTTEAEEAFQAMKKLIAELPTLTAPKKEEELVVYLSATKEAKLHTDRASREHGSGVGLILIDPEGAEYSYALQLNFTNSNNDAEYEALLAGLRIATKMKVEHMHVFVDSKLVANQVEGSYEAKGKKTKKYKEKVLEIIRSFSNFQISHIPREENRKADALSKLAAVQCEQLTKGVLIEELNERSVDMEKVNAIIEEQELG